MVDRRVWRVAFAVTLLLVLGVLFVDYSANVDDQDPYPTDEQIGSNFEAHVGEQAYVWADVTAVDENSFEIETDEFALTVQGPPEEANAGDYVQVYGTLQPGNVIVPERIVVSNQHNRTYMFVVSALAFLLTAGLFVREWTIDYRTLTIQPRER